MSAITLVAYERKQKTKEAYAINNNIEVGTTSFYNIRELIAYFLVWVHTREKKIKNWRNYCVGITSHYYDRRSDTYFHLPMFDYDGKDSLKKAMKDIGYLQNKHNLGNAHLFKTRNGIHVYFFSDGLSYGDYVNLLDRTSCCKGFKKNVKRRTYACLRISAKYTDFDIEPLSVVKSKNQGDKKPAEHQALVNAFVNLGMICNTHFASLFPQWAFYEEDVEPWKQLPVEKSLVDKTELYKTVYKVSQEEYNQLKINYNANDSEIFTKPLNLGHKVENFNSYVTNSSSSKWLVNEHVENDYNFYKTIYAKGTSGDTKFTIDWEKPAEVSEE